MILQYTQLLYWLKINTIFALYVRAFDRIVSEIVPDLFFLTLFIIQFANIFYVLNQSRVGSAFELLRGAPLGL